VIGSWHEENRLKEAFGEDYAAYLNSGAIFFVPAMNRSTIKSMSAVGNLELIP